MRSHMDPFHNSFGWGFVLGGSCAVPVGPQRGLFHWGEGDASSTQGVEVWKCACVSCLAACERRACVCVAYNDCEQKAQVRDAVWKDMPDLLAALWCMPLLCNPKLLWTNAGLCVCLPRSKKLSGQSPFPEETLHKTYLHLQCTQTDKSCHSSCSFAFFIFIIFTQHSLGCGSGWCFLMTNLITCLKTVKTSDQLWRSNQRKT